MRMDSNSALTPVWHQITCYWVQGVAHQRTRPATWLPAEDVLVQTGVQRFGVSPLQESAFKSHPVSMLNGRHSSQMLLPQPALPASSGVCAVV